MENRSKKFKIAARLMNINLILYIYYILMYTIPMVLFKLSNIKLLDNIAIVFIIQTIILLALLWRFKQDGQKKKAENS